MPPNDEFFSFLESSVNGLKEDFTSGARQMADNALGYLATLIDLAAGSARDREELWKMVVAGAKELSKARPSMRYVTFYVPSLFYFPKTYQY